MTDASFFCEPLWEVNGVRADFVSRVPGVQPSYDKDEVLGRLQPWHERSLEVMGFSWSQLRRAEQVHQAELAIVDASGDASLISGVDGLLTQSLDVCLGIYVADCAPIYLVDQQSGALALLHSGRKGSELNILGRAIECMGAEFGSRPEEILVILGPCIRPPHYEVDIVEMIRSSARKAGIRDEYFCDSGVCTADTMSWNYSYRMEKGLTGRMLALLGRKATAEV